MIFCSTSNVFDASTELPRYEEDPPNAASDYGQFKAKCEKVMAEMLHDKLTIVRIPTEEYHLLSKQIAYLMEQRRSGILHLVTIMVHSEFMKKLVTPFPRSFPKSIIILYYPIIHCLKNSNSITNS